MSKKYKHYENSKCYLEKSQIPQLKKCKLFTLKILKSIYRAD